MGKSMTQVLWSFRVGAESRRVQRVILHMRYIHLKVSF